MCIRDRAARIGRNDWNGNYLSYGVREFVMGTVMNGLAPVSYTHLSMVRT